MVLILSIPLIMSSPVKSFVGYENYTYSMKRVPSIEPPAFIPENIITVDIPESPGLSLPQDICTGPDGKIYIADSGNNRIVILERDYRFFSKIENFTYESTEYNFNNPSGVFVNGDNEIYVADTDNFRIVVFNSTYEVTKIIESPSSSTLETKLVFVPTKVAVDRFNRLFVVSRGNTDGLIQLDSDGSFIRFFGAISTSPSPSEIIWRRLMTTEQRQRISLNLPTIYSNVNIDDSGFIYATVSAVGGVFNPNIMVRKLNSMGIDILRRDGFFPPQGDVRLKYDRDSNSLLTSRFVDIELRSHGIYSVLDSNMGRIFTYDYYGRLLYVFGGYGEQFGSFGNPSSITYTLDDKYLVLDSKFNQIVVFESTDYSKMIDKAIKFQFDREYEAAEEVWKELANYSSKNSLIYDGLGRMAIKNFDYEGAMHYFKLSDNRPFYAEAFGFYRKEFMSENFGKIITIGSIFIIFLYIVKVIYKKAKRRNNNVKN